MSKFVELSSLEPRRLLATNLVSDLGGIYPTTSVTVNGVAYFVANNGTSGKELWKSDGTMAGTSLLKDITPGTAGSNITAMFGVGNYLVFYVQEGRSHAGLWTSDGTTVGTFRLCTAGLLQNFASAVVLDDKLIFSVPRGDGNHTASSLWTTDGTYPGTQQIADFAPDPNQYNWFQLYKIGDRAIMTTIGQHWDQALQNTIGSIWSTDGTTMGTTELTHATGSGSNGLVSIYQPTVLNDQLYFDDQDHEQLWVTDGTLAGTQHISQSIGDGEVYQIRAYANDVYFVTRHETDADEQGLWTTDGTVGGTIKLGMFAKVGFHSLDFGTAGVIGDKVIFGGTSAGNGAQLWITDGTVLGTKMIADFDDASVAPKNFRSVGGIVFFKGNDAAHGDELWRTDGTTAGTKLVRDITPGPASSGLENMTVVDGQLLVREPGHTNLFDPVTFLPASGPATGSISFTGGVVRVIGTRSADAIRMYAMSGDSTRFVVAVNNAKQTYRFSQVDRIYVYANGGDDSIAVMEKLGRFAARTRIWGGDGNDTVWGGAGRDSVYGERGNDQIFASNGDDQLDGGNGDDAVIAGPGNDTASGGDGSDSVTGNAGNDVLGGGNDTSKDTLDGSDGADVLFGRNVTEVFFGTQTHDELDTLFTS